MECILIVVLFLAPNGFDEVDDAEDEEGRGAANGN